MRCPICREEIEDGAKKCKHCGSFVTVGRRLWGSIRSGLQLCTLIAALVVLYFTWESNRAMQEQLQLQRASVEQLAKQFVEEKRPRIEIVATRIDVQDTTLVLYVDFDNRGVADAESVNICVVLKYEDEPGDTLAVDSSRVTKITNARPLTRIYDFRAPNTPNLICRVRVGYTWDIQGLQYEREKYFYFPYDRETRRYRLLLLDDDRVGDLWN